MTNNAILGALITLFIDINVEATLASVLFCFQTAIDGFFEVLLRLYLHLTLQRRVWWVFGLKPYWKLLHLLLVDRRAVSALLAHRWRAAVTYKWRFQNEPVHVTVFFFLVFVFFFDDRDKVYVVLLHGLGSDL